MKNCKRNRNHQDTSSCPSENELHELFSRLAELIDTVSTSRHIETLEAYQLIDRIINYYQL